MPQAKKAGSIAGHKPEQAGSSMSVSNARRRTSLRELLALEDDQLASLIVERREHGDSEFAFCRTAGMLLKRARQERGLTLHELSLETGASPRLMWLIEEGALRREQFPDEDLEAAVDILDINLDHLLEETDTMLRANPALADDPEQGELVAAIPSARDGLWAYSRRVPLRLRCGGDELLVGPESSLAYRRVTVEYDEDNATATIAFFVPGSGRLQLPLPQHHGTIFIYLN